MLENEEELKTRVFLALAAKDCSFIRFISLVLCFFLCLASIAFSPQPLDPPFLSRHALSLSLCSDDDKLMLNVLRCQLTY